MGELRASTRKEETIEVVVHWHATRQFGRHRRASDASHSLNRTQRHSEEQSHVMTDAHMEIDSVDQAINDTPPPPEDKPIDQPKGKSTAKPTASLVRESGKSLLPISRVQKIMKADKVRDPHNLHVRCHL